MKISKYVTILMIAFLVASCGEDNGFTPVTKEVKDLVEDGWETFGYSVLGAGTLGYQNALEIFNEAISKDSTYAEAYNGAGWASARLARLSDAIQYFQDGINLNANLIDAIAGLAFTYNAQKSYAASNTQAISAINQNNQWQFSYDQSVNYKDLYVILAENYFALKNYSQSLYYVKLLNPGFSADVNTIAGKSLLAEEIERLLGFA